MSLSLRAHLLIALLSALLLTGIIASGATYLRARGEIDRLFDYQLRQQALALRDHRFGSGMEADAEQDVVIQIWNRNGGQLYLSHRALALPRQRELGFADIRSDGEDWRVYAIAVGPDVIQVGQPLKVRRQMAAEAALRLLVPIVAVIPVFATLIWWIVGRGIKPLHRLADSLARREATSLTPLPASGLPRETLPMVEALNGLLARLRVAMETQREFTADAAHELRTPLTALKLQAQLLARAQSDRERTEAVEALNAGVERASHLVERLLTLARLEPEASHDTLTHIVMNDLARQVVDEFAAAASTREIDLRLIDSERFAIHGSYSAVRALLRNLVENAVRYTPAGGRIRVSLQRTNDHAVVDVADNGPGIPPAERDRVFDRFYRVPGTTEHGSGLGLAIARRAAQMHGGEVSLREGLDGRGLCARVTLPIT